MFFFIVNCCESAIWHTVIYTWPRYF